MFGSILEKLYGNSRKSNRLPFVVIEFELIPNLSDVYGVKYIHPELEELVLQYQGPAQTLTCIPWKRPINMHEFVNKLNRHIVVLTGKRGNFKRESSYFASQYGTKKPICVYRPTPSQYFFLPSNTKDMTEVLNALGLPLPTPIPQTTLSFYYFYTFASIIVLTISFALYYFENQEYMSIFKNQLESLFHDLTAISAYLKNWEEQILHKNNNLVSLGGSNFTDHILQITGNCQHSIKDTQESLIKLLGIINSPSFKEMVYHFLRKPSFNTFSAKLNIANCEKEARDLTQKIDEAIYNLSGKVVKTLSESQTPSFSYNTSTSVQNSNLSFLLIGILFYAAVTIFVYFRFFNKPNPVAHQNPIDSRIKVLEDTVNDLGNQLDVLKNDSDTIKKHQNTHNQQINNLENKTEKLKDTQQEMKQEIKYGSPIPSVTRQKMQESPPRLTANRYMETSPVKGISNPEPKLQSTLNNNNAAP